VEVQNLVLSEYLLTLTRVGGGRQEDTWEDSGFNVNTSPGASKNLADPIHVVVTLNEINDQHGTGPLVKRIFAGRRGIFSIRSRNDWGSHAFGDWDLKLSHLGCGRQECYRRILRALRGRRVNSVTCVPFLPEELVTCIAIKQAFNSKLCLYLMDDQNVAVNNIPDELMREFLEECTLRLATHPQLAQAYERKFNLPFYILPAVVPASLIPDAYESCKRPTGRAALLGSFWDQSWFDRLCAALEQSPYEIDWYGQNRSPWVVFSEEALARARITAHGILAEPLLAAELRKYPFVIVPGGALDEKEANRGVASLSLPGRILFAAATSNTPILLVGSKQSCGAHFVEHFGIGITVPYEATALTAAMELLSDPTVQAEMRRNAAAIASRLSDRGIVEWLAASIEGGRPADSRFEELFEGYNSAKEYRTSAASPSTN
jgi:hypothetical protein